MPEQPIVELRHVQRRFIKDRQVIPVIQDVDLSVYPQEILCIVGESGCGKTTTGKMIAGLLSPSEGEILFDGSPLESYKGAQTAVLRRSLQIVHQDPFASLNSAHTIEQILSFPLMRHKLVNSRSERRRRIWELLTMVDLTPPGDIVHKFPHQLSGGQRQRVSIARALTVNPRLIVADEAVSMVDVSIRVGILKMLQRLREDLKVAIVFITHDLALAQYFAWEGRVAVMYLGRIVEIGRTPDVISRPQHPYTRALVDAVPEIDPKFKHKAEHLRLRSEEIPKLTDIPHGCAFHPRCAFFQPGVCDAAVPVLEPSGEKEQLVACTPLTRTGKLIPYEAATT